MTVAERRYTLEEAERILAERTCLLHGHDFGFLTDAAGDPLELICEHCHRRWEVTPV